jgi:hypothetical protein
LPDSGRHPPTRIAKHRFFLNALVIRPVSVLTQVVQAGAFVNRSSSHWIYAQDGEVALVMDDTAAMIGWIILARLSFRPRPKTPGGSNTLAFLPCAHCQALV